MSIRALRVEVARKSHQGQALTRADLVDIVAKHGVAGGDFVHACHWLQVTYKLTNIERVELIRAVSQQISDWIKWESGK